MKNKEFYLITFNSTSHSIFAQKEAAKKFNITIIPTPTIISANCGLAIKFDSGTEPEISDFFKSLNVPAELYLFERENNRNKATRIDI